MSSSLDFLGYLTLQCHRSIGRRTLDTLPCRRKYKLYVPSENQNHVTILPSLRSTLLLSKGWLGLLRSVNVFLFAIEGIETETLDSRERFRGGSASVG